LKKHDLRAARTALAARKKPLHTFVDHVWIML